MVGEMARLVGEMIFQTLCEKSDQMKYRLDQRELLSVKEHVYKSL